MGVRSLANLSVLATPEERSRSLPVARAMFLMESLKAIRTTGSVAPSSRFLTGAMLAPLDFDRVENVLELGCGTGAITREILKRLRPAGRLIAIDINRKFIRHLQANSTDARLHAIESDAAQLQSVLAGLGLERVDAVVSSLALTCFSPARRAAILREVYSILRPGGVVTQYQYVGRPLTARFDAARLLRKFFGEVQVSTVLLNLPPALVFRCQK
jgi:phospholipid N-methyltransferase